MQGSTRWHMYYGIHGIEIESKVMTRPFHLEETLQDDRHESKDRVKNGHFF